MEWVTDKESAFTTGGKMKYIGKNICPSCKKPIESGDYVEIYTDNSMHHRDCEPNCD